VLNEAYDEWEFPKRKWVDGWNVGTPGFQGSFDFFEQWAEIDLEDFVRRDRNHPSVFAWSIGNEVDYPNDPYSHPVLDGGKDSGFTQPIFGGYQKDAPPAIRLGNIAKRLVSAVKKHDQTRPTTAGLAGVAMSNATDYPFLLDITGYNYTENKYHSDHKRYPNRVIYGSENRHEYEPWLAVKNNEFIFGQFLWTGIDYLGESREWPSRGFYSGLIDFIGNLKPRGYFRQSLWSKKPMVYIGTYPTNNKPLSIDAWDNWDYKEDQQIRVVCYTNMPMARLELNGKVVGKTKPYDNKTGIISWDIPYKSGKLVAVGLNEDENEVCRFTVKTSSQPTELHVANDKPILIEKNNGVAQITLHILDVEGDVVTKAENKITCHVEGAAVLLGLDAANNSDMSDYSDNVHNAYRGKISAFIKATGENEPIKVTFSSPGIGKKEVIVDFK